MDLHAMAAVMTPIDPRALQIVIDELTSALVAAMALRACATQGTPTDAEALNAAIRRATAAIRRLQLDADRGRR
jgi:hypothetical protein